MVIAKGQEAIKKALVERRPRGDFKLATKLCAWLQCHDEASAKQQFYTSLERTGAGYFDFYLLHALQSSNLKLYDDYHLWDFVKELKAQGLVKNWGFSFHDKPELLDEILTKHPDADFVQLQINYADWENPVVCSRRNYEMARKHGKSIVVMEPVKGGTLSAPPESVKKLFAEVAPGLSPASWAIRFAASLDGVITVLSGMSDENQMRDNLSYMKDFQPLTDQEQKAIVKAREILDSIESIPCTACHYCTHGCPKQIPIPEIFAARNRLYVFGDKARAQQDYGFATAGGAKASDCIACGQCERACPQQLDVIARLKECVKTFE